MSNLVLPRVVAFAGKKKSGKDFAADCLVRDAEFTKLHIVEPWLRLWMAEHGLDPDNWEELKARYRAEIQRDALKAREGDPLRLIRVLPARINEVLAEGESVAITGVRFINEATWMMQQGYLVVKVEVEPATRMQRFVQSGEDLALFNDPFETEIDLLPWHLCVAGDQPAEVYTVCLSAAYVAMLAEKEHQRKAA